MDAIQRYESEVRSYVRSFPVAFDTARGHELVDREGRRYLDFFSGAGVLNYGHNHPALKQALLAYIERDGIAHSLDMASTAKARFLETFHDRILAPRGLDYKVQFPGPTGTNAVEAALKLARKVTGRESIVSFTNAFHGMTLGALSITGNAFKRSGAGVPLVHGTAMPYYGYFGDDVDTVEYLEQFLSDGSSGVDMPAAIVVETVQCEGGINVADFDWLRRLADLAKRFDILFVVDDIQTGVGRTGPFFSFEPVGITPDIVSMSKSLSGSGQPFAVTLFKPELDVWEPGEHNGTFRGNNYAMVTSTTAIDTFWRDDALSQQVGRQGDTVRAALGETIAGLPPEAAHVRGRGMVNGIYFEAEGRAKAVCRAAFERGLIMETSGPAANVAKVMPPLTIDDAALADGLGRLREAVDAVLERPAGADTKDVA